MCVYISVDTEKTWAYILWQANSKKNEQVYCSQTHESHAMLVSGKRFGRQRKKNTSSLPSNFGFHLEEATLRELKFQTLPLSRLRDGRAPTVFIVEAGAAEKIQQPQRRRGTWSNGSVR